MAVVKGRIKAHWLPWGKSLPCVPNTLCAPISFALASKQKRSVNKDILHRGLVQTANLFMQVLIHIQRAITGIGNCVYQKLRLAGGDAASCRQAQPVPPAMSGSVTELRGQKPSPEPPICLTHWQMLLQPLETKFSQKIISALSTPCLLFNPASKEGQCLTCL